MADVFFDQMMRRARAMDRADRTRANAWTCVEAGCTAGLALALVPRSSPAAVALVGLAAVGCFLASIALGVRAHRQRSEAP